MKRFLLILLIVFLSALSCEQEDPVDREVVFTQTLGVGTPRHRQDHAVYIEWTGEDIVEIKYDVFDKLESSRYSDKEIRSKLGLKVYGEQMSELEQTGKTRCEFLTLLSETEYEVVSLAKNSKGFTKLCRETLMTDRIPNSFEQVLSLERTAENDYYMTVIANCTGTYIRKAQSGIFVAAESENIPDEEIIDNLTYEFSAMELVSIYSFEGCSISYKDLDVNVEYEVVSYAIHRDGTSKICRDKITTKENQL